MNTTRSTYRLMVMLLLPVAFASCKKDEELDPWAGLEDGKSTLIRDLAGDTNGSMSGDVDGKTKKGFDVFLFRFSDKKQIWLRNAADSARWLKTDEWDLAFTGPYNSEVFVNNADYFYNPGYQGPAANTAVVMLDQAYDNVNEAPDDQTFEHSDVKKIGWAVDPYSIGWFFYNETTHLAVPVKNRTWAIRLPDGKFAKLELINVYQGNPPEVSNLNWPAPYFTFRYYVQQDGSKNLKTQ